MKVIVCGGRDYNDLAEVNAALDKAHAKRPITMLVHGTSHVGVFAAHWARGLGVMEGAVVSGDALACEPDGVIAFPGAPAEMVAAAREAGVKVWCPYGEGE